MKKIIIEIDEESNICNTATTIDALAALDSCEYEAIIAFLTNCRRIRAWKSLRQHLINYTREFGTIQYITNDDSVYNLSLENLCRAGTPSIINLD